MRPIKLEMTAFGPYSAVEVIDFRELSGRNLFLINGPTGAGKTTIFDAISFAMYGVANGSLRQTETLRSQFADPKLLTEVSLSFLLRGVTYRVKRVPNQLKPKTRGEGFTNHSADAELYIEGEEKPITGYTAVTKKIESVMGISADQFRQIMMIPQGEFRKLLTSNSEEREKVLRRLFDTSIYSAFQKKIDDDAKAIYKEIRKDFDLRTHELKKVQSKSEDIIELLQAEDLNEATILEALDEQNGKDSVEIDQLSKIIKVKREAVEKAVRDKEKAENQNKLLEDLDKLRLKLNEEKKREDYFDDMRNRVKLGEATEAILPYEDQFMALHKRIKVSERDFEKLSNEFELKDQELNNIKVSYQQMTSNETQIKLDQMLSQVQKYKSFVDQVHRSDLLKKDIGKNEQILKDKQVEQLRLNESLLADKKAQEELEKKVLEIQEGKLKLSNQQADKAKMDQRMETINKAISLKKRILDGERKIKVLDAGLKSHLVDFENLDTTYKTLRINFHLNQASLLAKELNEGMPCPVCGSLDHPNPAPVQENSVTEDMLNESEKAVNDKREQCQKEQVELESFNKLKEDLIKQLNIILGELNISEDEILNTRSELEKDQYGLEKSIGQLKKLMVDEKGLMSSLEDLKKDLVKSQDHLEKVDGQIQNLITDVKVQKGQVAQMLEDVPKDLINLSQLKEKVGSLEKERDTLNKERDQVIKNYETLSNQVMTLDGQVKAFEKTLSEENQRLKDLREDLQSRLKDAGFEDSSKYKDAKFQEGEKAKLNDAIKNHEQDLHTMGERIKVLQADTQGLKRVDLLVFDENLAKLKDQRDELIHQRTEIEKRLDINRGILEGVKEISKRVQSKEAVYKVVGNLAKVAKGSNRQNITFERYVLAAFLEDILKAANLRLDKMTQGRYILSRTKELQRKNAQSGLELEVFDQYTGKSRHVKTLSGGEGFKASLAMALGLSDVVQSYSGGVQLDTMFIDEGFGTLDQESLDYAISCLIDLQEAGRLVGIISHVQELKERMDARLEVMASQTGSTTKFLIQ